MIAVNPVARDPKRLCFAQPATSSEPTRVVPAPKTLAKCASDFARMTRNTSRHSMSLTTASKRAFESPLIVATADNDAPDEAPLLPEDDSESVSHHCNHHSMGIQTQSKPWTMHREDPRGCRKKRIACYARDVHLVDEAAPPRCLLRH